MSSPDIEEIQIEEEADDSTDFGTTTQEREVLTKSGDPEVRALHDKYKRGKLILQPDFQRCIIGDAELPIGRDMAFGVLGIAINDCRIPFHLQGVRDERGRMKSEVEHLRPVSCVSSLSHFFLSTARKRPLRSLS